MTRTMILAAALVMAAFAPAYAKSAENMPADAIGAHVSLARVANNPNALVLKIRMPEGWHTYWQYAGDAGIAPQFEIAGVQSAIVEYPVPQSFDENGLTTFGYADHVAFPVIISGQTTTDVIATVHYAVCKDICIPMRAQVSTRGTAAIMASQFDAIKKTVPQKVSGGTATLTHTHIDISAAPYAGPYLLVLPNGIVHTGTTDAGGTAQAPLPFGATQQSLAGTISPLIIQTTKGPKQMQVVLTPQLTP